MGNKLGVVSRETATKGVLSIVCGAPASEMDADFENTEVWVLGNRADKYPRFDRIFEIHDDLSQHDERYAKWLTLQKVPLIVGEKFPIKGDNIEVFPYKEAEDLFGSTYLTSSPAYMLAYAILKGYKHIKVFGVDLAVDSHEYFWQRPCFEAWIGFAKGRGIKVELSEKSPALRCHYVEGRDFKKGECVDGRPDFGKPPFTENQFIQMGEQHSEKMKQIEEKIDSLQVQWTSHDAALQVYSHLSRIARGIEAGADIQTLTGTQRLKDGGN